MRQMGSTMSPKRGSPAIAQDQPTPSTEPDESDQFTVTLEHAHAAFSNAIDEVASKLTPEALASLGDPEISQQSLSDLLGNRAAAILQKLGQVHHFGVREQLKAQAVTYEAKLAQARKASSMEVANQAAKLEFSYTQKMEEVVAASEGESGELVAEAQRVTATVKTRLETAQMNFTGVSEAFKIAEKRSRANEAAASKVEEGLRGELREALARVEAGLAANEALQEEKAQQKVMLMAALKAERELTAKCKLLAAGNRNAGAAANKILALEAEVKTLEGKVKEVEEVAAQQKTTMKEMKFTERRLTAQLEDEQKAKEAVLAELEEVKAGGGEKVARLEAELVEAQRTMNKRGIELGNALTDVAELTEKLEQSNKRGEAAKRRANKAEGTCATLEEELKAERGLVKKLQAEVRHGGPARAQLACPLIPLKGSMHHISPLSLHTRVSPRISPCTGQGARRSQGLGHVHDGLLEGMCLNAPSSPNPDVTLT